MWVSPIDFSQLETSTKPEIKNSYPAVNEDERLRTLAYTERLCKEEIKFLLEYERGFVPRHDFPYYDEADVCVIFRAHGIRTKVDGDQYAKVLKSRRVASSVSGNTSVFMDGEKWFILDHHDKKGGFVIVAKHLVLDAPFYFIMIESSDKDHQLDWWLGNFLTYWTKNHAHGYCIVMSDLPYSGHN
jgi:hypothetical protein